MFLLLFCSGPCADAVRAIHFGAHAYCFQPALPIRAVRRSACRHGGRWAPAGC